MDLSDIDEVAYDSDHESDESGCLELILLNRKEEKIQISMLIFWNINGMNRKGLDPQVTMSKQEERIEKKKKLEQQNKVLVAGLT